MLLVIRNLIRNHSTSFMFENCRIWFTLYNLATFMPIQHTIVMQNDMIGFECVDKVINIQYGWPSFWFKSTLLAHQISQLKQMKATTSSIIIHSILVIAIIWLTKKHKQEALQITTRENYSINQQQVWSSRTRS